MAYAQSNDARARALQGTWKKVYSKYDDGSIFYDEDYKNGKGLEEYWTFDGNALITKIISWMKPNGFITVYTFRVVGDEIVIWGQLGELKIPYTLNGDTLIFRQYGESAYRRMK
jgi:hypothetical protein